MLVRRLADFHVILNVGSTEDDEVRLWLEDGSTITLGSSGLVELAQWAIHDSMTSHNVEIGLQALLHGCCKS
jgi:hypothetical protein